MVASCRMPSVLRSRLLAGALVVLGTANVAQCLACSCSFPRTREEALQKSAIVLHATPIWVEYMIVRSSRPSYGTVAGGGTDVHLRLILLRVKNSWKGHAHRYYLALSSASSCGSYVPFGKEWILYATHGLRTSRRPRSPAMLWACTRSVTPTQEELVFLGPPTGAQQELASTESVPDGNGWLEPGPPVVSTMPFPRSAPELPISSWGDDEAHRNLMRGEGAFWNDGATTQERAPYRLQALKTWLDQEPEAGPDRSIFRSTLELLWSRYLLGESLPMRTLDRLIGQVAEKWARDWEAAMEPASDAQAPGSTKVRQ